MGNEKVTTGFMDLSNRMYRRYAVTRCSAKIYTTQPYAGPSLKETVSSIVEKYAGPKVSKAGVRDTLSFLYAAVMDIHNSVPLGKNALLQVFAPPVSACASRALAKMHNSWYAGLEVGVVDDAGQISTKPLFVLTLSAFRIRDFCTVPGWAGADDSVKIYIYGNLRDPRTLVNASSKALTTGDGSVQEPDIHSVTDELLTGVAERIRGRRFTSSTDFLNSVRHRLDSTFQAGSLARYIDLDNVEVELRRSAQSRLGGKGRGERYTTSRGPGTLSRASQSAASNKPAALTTAGRRIEVDGKVKFLLEHQMLNVTAHWLSTSTKDVLAPVNRLSMTLSGWQHNTGTLSPPAEFFDKFDRSCVSSKKSGLPCIIEGLISASKGLELSRAHIALDHCLAIAKAEPRTWAVVCHYAEESSSSWQIGFRYIFRDAFHLTIKVKDGGPADIHLMGCDIMGILEPHSQGLRSTKSELTLTSEKDDLLKDATATLLKVSSGMSFDSYKTAPSLLAEAVLRTTTFKTPGLLTHSIRLRILGTDHFPSGDVSASWNDLVADTEFLLADSKGDERTTEPDATLEPGQQLVVAPDNTSDVCPNDLARDLSLVEQTSNPLLVSMPPRLQHEDLTRATGFRSYGFSVLLPDESHSLNLEVMGLDSEASIDRVRTRIVEIVRSELSNLHEGDFAALQAAYLRTAATVGGSRNLSLVLSDKLVEVSGAEYEIGMSQAVSLSLRQAPGDSVGFSLRLPPMTNLSAGLEEHNDAAQTPAWVSTALWGHLEGRVDESPVSSMTQIQSMLTSIADVLKGSVDGQTYATCSDFAKAATMALVESFKTASLSLSIHKVKSSCGLRAYRLSDASHKADFAYALVSDLDQRRLQNHENIEGASSSRADIDSKPDHAEWDDVDPQAVVSVAESDRDKQGEGDARDVPEIVTCPGLERSTDDTAAAHESSLQVEHDPQSDHIGYTNAESKGTARVTESAKHEQASEDTQLVSQHVTDPDLEQSTDDSAATNSPTGPMDDGEGSFNSAMGRRMQPGVIIALGSNMGDRVEEIERACRAIDEDPDMRIVDTSCLYESEPMYVENQEKFINGVCEIETSLSPIQLLDRLQAIEQRHGRVKLIDKGPRNIDLDILLYRDECIQSARLTVPHALMYEREFVLRPLKDLASPNNVFHSRSSKVDTVLARLGATKMHSFTPLGKSLTPIAATNPARPTAVMSILNTTPDSFSDGGCNSPENFESLKAVAASHIAAGASIIDVGGQSSRPNAPDISADEEISRILPAIKAIRSLPEATNIIISVDTYRAAVAEAAVNAGAHVVNDISAGQLDDQMFSTVARLGCSYAVMHMRGTPATMTNPDKVSYPRGVQKEVRQELMVRIDKAVEAGVRRWRILADPGIGFAKTHDQNTELLRTLGTTFWVGRISRIPMLVGTSRKGFIGSITGVEEPRDRTYGTAATVTAAIAGGASIVRVHDVKEMAQVAKMADAMYRRLPLKGLAVRR